MFKISMLYVLFVKVATLCSASPSFLATDNCVSCNWRSFSTNCFCRSRSFSFALAYKQFTLKLYKTYDQMISQIQSRWRLLILSISYCFIMINKYWLLWCYIQLLSMNLMLFDIRSKKKNYPKLWKHILFGAAFNIKSTFTQKRCSYRSLLKTCDINDRKETIKAVTNSSHQCHVDALILNPTPPSENWRLISRLVQTINQPCMTGLAVQQYQRINTTAM